MPIYRGRFWRPPRKPRLYGGLYPRLSGGLGTMGISARAKTWDKINPRRSYRRQFARGSAEGTLPAQHLLCTAPEGECRNLAGLMARRLPIHFCPDKFSGEIGLRGPYSETRYSLGPRSPRWDREALDSAFNGGTASTNARSAVEALTQKISESRPRRQAHSP